MTPPIIGIVGLLAILSAPLTLSASPRVFYAGGAGDQEFYDVVRLSSGNYLVAGRTSDLGWIPAQVPKTQALNAGLITSPNSSQTFYGLLLVVSADFSTIHRAWYLPKGAAENIRRIRTTEVPGQATGDIYISGNVARPHWGDNQGGYFIAKLDANFVAGTPNGLAWALNIGARGDTKTSQPWDVSKAGGDTLLIAVSGNPHSYDWMAADFYDGNGQPKSLANLRVAKAEKDRILLKRTNTGDMRSWTLADYNAVISDGNGGLKKGRWPLDVLSDGPYGLPGNGAGRGYTGYKVAATYADNIAAVVIDRRNNEFYLGCNAKSVLPDGNPDFEPWVIKYDGSGTMQWWNRLYPEWKDLNANGAIDINVDSNTDGVMDRSSEGLVSTPDQYVDALALDYTSNFLVVGARAHGNNVTNFWQGDGAAIAARPAGYLAFQKQFTGTNGNAHYSWIGKLATANGSLAYATYLAGFDRYGTVNSSALYPEPIHDGWPSHNSGWPQLNTTRIKPNRLQVDAIGRIYLVGSGPRMVTTSNAYQKIGKPPINAPWHDFVRVFEPDLTALAYSSALAGAWTYDTGGNPVGAEGVVLNAMVPTSDGVLVVGGSTAVSGVPAGNAMPTAGAPSWGNSVRTATMGVVGMMPFSEDVWATQDIGPVGVVGSAIYDAPTDTFTVAGSGADIWGSSDQFRFVHQALTGDGEIIARVTQIQNTDPWAKTGVMMRDSLVGNARNVFMCLSYSNGLRFQRRTAAGGSTSATSGGAATAPRWVRLVRSGNNFTAFSSTDGTAWTQVGTPVSIAMNQTIYVGLAVTSHKNTVLNTSKFTGVNKLP